MGNARILLRRGTAARWESENPLLMDGEPGYEKDTRKFKIGDGRTSWNDLAYVQTDVDISSDPEALIQQHIDNLTPHPVYDDGPSLLLLYENAKV